VSEGNECENGDNESDDYEEENNEKPIVRGKTEYDYCNDEGLFIEDDEVYIDENAGS
jgi:hypothetical protein